ncbi:hypothetical protein ACIO8H_35040 [Streptomyces sp. NPDC087226]|uniref:hypothetical protein n=1 Tax=Streptomyces sp. NPDC087226 TaxID=3365771 RepID=UPI00381699B7
MVLHRACGQSEPRGRGRAGEDDDRRMRRPALHVADDLGRRVPGRGVSHQDAHRLCALFEKTPRADDRPAPHQRVNEPARQQPTDLADLLLALGNQEHGEIAAEERLVEPRPSSGAETVRIPSA